MERIQKSTLAFLSDIKTNNNKDWFNANRSRYTDARNDFEGFVQALIDAIVKFDPILKGLEARSCMYRINRDIRFSNDKTVYKSHFGAFIVRGGKQNGDRYAGYYIHIEPGNNSMVAGGAYMPPMPWLTAIRERIAEEGDTLRRILSNRNFIKYYTTIEGEKLKSAPKGFPKDHPEIELLKMKSFLVSRILKDKETTESNAFDLILEGCRIMKPFNDFLNGL